VDVSDQKTKAGDIARKVSGARDIDNDIMAKDKINP
jgi:osmotically-inducible protein OsmY